MLGIGGGACSGDVSWTQNRMLRRLNAAASDGENEGEERTRVSVVVPGGFVRAIEGRGMGEEVVVCVCVEEVGEKGRRRDRAPSGLRKE